MRHRVAISPGQPRRRELFRKGLFCSLLVVPVMLEYFKDGSAKTFCHYEVEVANQIFNLSQSHTESEPITSRDITPAVG